MVCWMGEQPLTERRIYTLKHTTNATRAMVTEVDYRLDVTSTHRDASATSLASNDLGRIRLRSTTPLAYDAYRRNRTTGGFVLIDEATNTTVAAGMLLEPRG
jgi:bifunctional enzyme CysN/CysC